MHKQELLKQVRDLKELKVMAEELQAEITAIEDSIKAEMTAQNVTELHAGMFKIRFVDVTTNRFDTTAFKETYKDLYKQFLKQTISKRFDVV